MVALPEDIYGNSFVPLEEGDRVGALECQHNFHVDCLKSWLSRRNACPLCAVPIAKRRQPIAAMTTQQQQETMDTDTGTDNAMAPTLTPPPVNPWQQHRHLQQQQQQQHHSGASNDENIRSSESSSERSSVM